MARALVIGPPEQARLRRLAAQAEHNPVHLATLAALLQTPAGAAAYRTKMERQTVGVPHGFLVTFSVEEGHAVGRCRHLSVSLYDAGDRAPHPHAVWTLATELGFWGVMDEMPETCRSWPETIEGGIAINLVQPWDRAQIEAMRRPGAPAGVPTGATPAG